MPALVALIRGLTIRAGMTLRSRIPTRVLMFSLTPEALAEIRRPMGTKLNSRDRKMMMSTMMMMGRSMFNSS